MANVLAIYRPPAPLAFDDYCANTLTASVKKNPGRRLPETSVGRITNPTRPAPFHQIAILTFDDMVALQAGIGSAEGQTAVGDTADFASGGASVLMFERSAA